MTLLKRDTAPFCKHNKSGMFDGDLDEEWSRELGVPCHDMAQRRHLMLRHRHTPRVLPASLGRMAHLCKLTLEGVSVVELPPTLGDLEHLNELVLRNCPRLTTLPGEIVRLRALVSVDLTGSGLVLLPHALCYLPNLRFLNLSRCEALGRLPAAFGHLLLLRYLNLMHSGVDALPDSLGDLNSLQYLNLQGCRRLAALPDSVVRLHRLRFLDYHGSGVESAVVPDHLRETRPGVYSAVVRTEFFVEERAHGETCPVCMEEQEYMVREGTVWGCTHRFCGQCVAEWKGSYPGRAPCPMCRAPILGRLGDSEF
jgi:hypothetical protein